LTDEDTDIAALIAKSTEVDTHDFVDETDEDDYVSMVHYRAPDGRHFRHVIASCCAFIVIDGLVYFGEREHVNLKLLHPWDLGERLG